MTEFSVGDHPYGKFVYFDEGKRDENSKKKFTKLKKSKSPLLYYLPICRIIFVYTGLEYGNVCPVRVNCVDDGAQPKPHR